MFEFVKKAFFTELTFLSTLTCVNLLSCISMTIKNVEYDHKLLMSIVMSLCFSLLVLKQVNVAVVVTISVIHMRKCVFLML